MSVYFSFVNFNDDSKLIISLKYSKKWKISYYDY